MGWIVVVGILRLILILRFVLAEPRIGVVWIAVLFSGRSFVVE